MNIKVLNKDFSVSKLSDTKNIDFTKHNIFLGITDEEISLVCETKDVPRNVIKKEDNWKCLKIEGELDFSLIGIIAKISNILAENKISVFVVSTFNTDYILIKKENLNKTVSCLKENNYNIHD